MCNDRIYDMFPKLQDRTKLFCGIQFWKEFYWSLTFIYSNQWF